MILTLLLSFVISISAGGPECGDVTLIKPLCDVLNSTIKMDQNEPSKCINNENQGKWTAQPALPRPMSTDPWQKFSNKYFSDWLELCFLWKKSSPRRIHFREFEFC